MISFEFTPDQTAFQQTLADFSRKVLLPGYRDRAASTEFPFDILRQLGELGLLGIGLPEQYGGTGTEDPVTLGIATETLAYGDVNMASAPVQIGLVGSQLVPGRDPTPLSSAIDRGEENVAIALTEPGSGSDAGALTTIATSRGRMALNGEKTAISWAMHASAALVYAREPAPRSPASAATWYRSTRKGHRAPHARHGMPAAGLGLHPPDDVFIPTPTSSANPAKDSTRSWATSTSAAPHSGFCASEPLRRAWRKPRRTPSSGTRSGSPSPTTRDSLSPSPSTPPIWKGPAGSATGRCGYVNRSSRTPRWPR